MFRNMAAVLLGLFIGIMLSNLLGSGLVFIQTATGLGIANLYYGSGLNIVTQILVIAATITAYWKYL